MVRNAGLITLLLVPFACVAADRMSADAKAVIIYRDGLRRTLSFTDSRPDLFPVKRLSSARMLPRGQKEEIWNAWKSFLDYMLALDATGKQYRNFYLLNSPDRSRAFAISYAAWLAQYHSAQEFIDRAQKDPAFSTLLNESVPEIGLNSGTYAKLKFRFLNVARATEFAAFQATALALKSDVALPQLANGMKEDAEYIRHAGEWRGEVLTIANALSIIQRTGFTAYFPVQAGVSEWMGDTKVYRTGRSLISADQIRVLTAKLQPGDILLVRREWYLSNIGLPGFWPHAALYIGAPQDRAAYFNDPEVKEWLRVHGDSTGDFEHALCLRNPQSCVSSKNPIGGKTARVIEAMSEGVSFTAIEHCLDADSVAVLRPRLSKREKAEAIFRAFHYAGRPYDFNFDFLTDAELVCTELIYKSYEPGQKFHGLRFPLLNILGRKATPANEVVHQFDIQYGSSDQQTDFILFLDGVERAGKAVDGALQSFRQSWKRPKWHILESNEQ